ncbi:MAG TPA: hypothetical protein EYP14_18215, partial [Planctomycetaceae bacterium]|nr:hypothetical protein [Planctomycetaceae bacterium]
MSSGAEASVFWGHVRCLGAECGNSVWSLGAKSAKSTRPIGSGAGGSPERTNWRPAPGIRRTTRRLTVAVTVVPSGSHLGRLNVVVLAGGRSAERAISLQSGEAVSRALLARGHRVRVIDPAEVNLRKFPWRTVDVVFLALHGEFGEDG